MYHPILPNYHISNMKSPIHRVRQFVTTFQKYFDEVYDEGWNAVIPLTEMKPDPKSLECFVRAMEDRETFVNFNKVHSTSTPLRGICQCTLVEKGNQYILSKKIPNVSFTFECDCSKQISTLVPLGTNSAGMTYDICEDLIEGHFDHLFTSLHSIPSIDQPGHGGCVYTGIATWTHNEQVRRRINEVYTDLGFPTLLHLSDTHVRIIISLFSHSFISGEISCEIFNSVLNRLDDSPEKVYDRTVLHDEEIEPFIEWLLVGTSKHIAGDDEPTLAKLRRNVQSLTPKGVGGLGNANVESLAAAAFFEIVFPVKYAIYSVNEGLYTLMSSDVLLFNDYFVESEGKAMKPVILVIIVISSSHLDKTIVLPGVGAYVKGEHSLPQWVKESAKRIEAAPGSVAEFILNWDDGNNAIFTSGTDSEEARKFKRSKRGQWISKLPRFKELTPSDADENLAKTHLYFTPIGILLGVLLDTFHNELGPQLANWMNEYRMKTHLFGCSLWEPRWSYMMKFELQFIYTHRHEFFNSAADLMTVHHLTAKVNDWHHTSLIEMPVTTPRVSTTTSKVPKMLAELRDHNSAPSSDTIQPKGQGSKRHRDRAGAYTFGFKNIGADKLMPCAVAAIATLVLWITGVDVLDQVNDRFPPMNNIGVSFTMLCSVEIVHELIDWKFLPVESTKRGGILWKSKLFRELAVGFYWVQLDLRDGVQFTAEHVIAVHIFKEWKLCNDPEEYVACLLDNRGRSDFVQLQDIDGKRGTDVGENIFCLFLGIPNSRITSVIRLQPRTEKNSTYSQAADTAAKYKDKRLTRRLSSQYSSLTTSTTSSRSKNSRRRGKQRAKSRTSKSNTIERVKRLYNRALHSTLHLQPMTVINSDLPRKSESGNTSECPPNTRSGRNDTHLSSNLS